MKIYVEKVLDEAVYFSIDYGKAKGKWKGNNRPTDKVYYVEMDIDTLCDYESFVLCDTKEYHIEIETNFDERFYAMKNSYLTIIVEKLNIYEENLYENKPWIELYVTKGGQ